MYSWDFVEPWRNSQTNNHIEKRVLQAADEVTYPCKIFIAYMGHMAEVERGVCEYTLVLWTIETGEGYDVVGGGVLNVIVLSGVEG